jgi:CPA1 family monovalent cation:H+ antiporter
MMRDVTAFEALAILLVVTATFAYANHRLLKHPPALALMTMALVCSLVLMAFDRLGWLHAKPLVVAALERFPLDETLFHGMLGVLLFAGSLHVDINHLREEKVAITALAVGGTLVSTFFVGAVAWTVLPFFGVHLTFAESLLFGALISPTDPIAVLGILRLAGIPRRMEMQIAGEALFNDGVGVVLFVTILGFMSDGALSGGHVGMLILREAVGGAAFGLASGYLVYRMLKSIDHYQTELMLTLALVFGGYALAERLHLSAPIAAVVAGLLIGNQGRWLGMSDVTRDHLDKFWSLMDEIMNAILFVLIGFEMLALKVSALLMMAGLAMIVVVLLGRALSVALPVFAFRRWAEFGRGSIKILTWGGLRGGISVALALSAPATAQRNVLVVLTYVVVVFSLIVQGGSLGRVAKRAIKAA